MSCLTYLGINRLNSYQIKFVFSFKLTESIEIVKGPGGSRPEEGKICV